MRVKGGAQAWVKEHRGSQGLSRRRTQGRGGRGVGYTCGSACPHARCGTRANLDKILQCAESAQNGREGSEAAAHKGGTATQQQQLQPATLIFYLSTRTLFQCQGARSQPGRPGQPLAVRLARREKTVRDGLKHCRSGGGSPPAPSPAPPQWVAASGASAESRTALPATRPTTSHSPERRPAALAGRCRLWPRLPPRLCGHYLADRVLPRLVGLPRPWAGIPPAAARRSVAAAAVASEAVPAPPHTVPPPAAGRRRRRVATPAGVAVAVPAVRIRLCLPLTALPRCGPGHRCDGRQVECAPEATASGCLHEQRGLPSR